MNVYLTMVFLCSVAQLCPTLCDPLDWSPPGSSVLGDSQARMLEWVAMSSSRGSFQTRAQTQVSCTAGGFFTDWATREAKKMESLCCTLEANLYSKSATLQLKKKTKKLSISFLVKKWSASCSLLSDSLWPHGLYSKWNSPGQNTGVGSLFLLQGIFPTQGSNPGLSYCRQILCHLSHKGSPRILGSR